MGDTALYVYGVIEQEDVEFQTSGVDGADTAYTIDYQALSALVTDIDVVEPERTDENLRAHDEVLQQLLRYDGGRSVVPMQFGMAFRNARTLKSVLREARPAFKRALREIEGTVELGLKVLTETGTDVDGEAVGEEISDRFDELAIGVTDEDLFSERLLLNRSFLVERETRDEFDRAVDEFDAEHDDLLVQYTGPWAPYNFVDIAIGATQ